ncbi:hypothetical protein SCWH03_10320 [Streptomyces pacificus]|uniref:Uncharacterized protein n=1 Tax=Streptomyces pacificus TaxID=2705029 RepID=A0A6A0AQ97_9ACTN|nr:hypothetical protein SCWH03_10320 [Streptomyces pacificus]
MERRTPRGAGQGNALAQRKPDIGKPESRAVEDSARTGWHGGRPAASGAAGRTFFTSLRPGSGIVRPR